MLDAILRSDECIFCRLDRERLLSLHNQLLEDFSNKDRAIMAVSEINKCASTAYYVSGSKHVVMRKIIDTSLRYREMLYQINEFSLFNNKSI
jgi:hypothetical protein